MQRWSESVKTQDVCLWRMHRGGLIVDAETLHFERCARLILRGGLQPSPAAFLRFRDSRLDSSATLTVSHSPTLTVSRGRSTVQLDG